MTTTTLRPAIFLDRDGVINKGGKVDRAEEFELIPGVCAALESLRRAGFLLVLVTNQGGLGEDLDGNVIWDEARLDRTHLNEIHSRMRYLLGLSFDAIKFCPHAYWDSRADCTCHKPKPGMILEAARELGIDIDNSWMIGDRAGDMLSATAAGISHRILVKSGTSPNEDDKVRGGLFITPTLVEAAALIIALKQAERPLAC